MMWHLKSYFLDFFSLIYPRVCFACHKTLLQQEDYLCTWCLFELPQTNLFREKDNPMTDILRGRIFIETATALFYFQKGGKVQHLIHQFKYKGKTELGQYLGRMLGNQIKDHPLWLPIDIIIPVPLHPKKQHKRGFNQSEVFGQGISQTFNRPMIINNLVRVDNTATQTRKSRFHRWENVSTGFKVKDPDSLTNKNILLIDDVITTGSTLEACASVLLQTEGVRIWVATLAMAL